jgi:4-hydroxy-3-methylbut-2-enyl diphosphate reductase
MNVVVDPHSGFCFGVVFAVEVAERELQQGGPLYCLGDIVHNTLEVDRLKSLGLEIISHEALASLHDCRVMIRAHGEPPETYRLAAENNLALIDASCPIVLNLQHAVRMGYLEMLAVGGQVVIYGKAGHAEVTGLLGQAGELGIVVGGEEDLHRIDFSRPVRLYSQTTKSIEGFERIARQIGDSMRAAAGSENIDYTWNDSVCRQVSGRAGQLKEFAASCEVIIFVSGKKSSNGMVLYEVCRSSNPSTYLVAGPEELQAEWFAGISKTGVCGATSTPAWLLEEVRREIVSLTG